MLYGTKGEVPEDGDFTIPQPARKLPMHNTTNANSINRFIVHTFQFDFLSPMAIYSTAVPIGPQA